MSDKQLKVEKSGDLEIRAERWFDAPRDRVWQAFTDPELIAQWWGPGGSTATTVDKMDVRPGGAWRFVHTEPDGPDSAFRGEFREIEEPERITWTFEFEGMPGHVSTETVTFTEQDGGTLVRTVSVFDSQQDRDGMLDSGMEKGMTQAYEQLAELLAKVEAG